MVSAGFVLSLSANSAAEDGGRCAARLGAGSGTFLLPCTTSPKRPVFGYLALRRRVAEQDRDVIIFRLSQFSGEYAQRGMSGLISLAAQRVRRAEKVFFVRVATLENATLFIRDADDWADFSPQQLESPPLPPEEEISWVSLWSPTGYELLIAENRLPDGHHHLSRGGEVASASEPERGAKFSVTLRAWKEDLAPAKVAL